MRLLARGADGKWDKHLLSQYRHHFGAATTDERGRFHLSGLPPGEYLVEADLTLSEHSTTVMPMPTDPTKTMQMTMTTNSFSLPLFPGNVWRQKLASPIDVGKAEEKSGIDLTFPLSTLHPVNGRALARDGHPVNAGNVVLRYADDHEQLANTRIEYADQSFHLDFVPEGRVPPGRLRCERRRPLSGGEPERLHTAHA